MGVMVRLLVPTVGSAQNEVVGLPEESAADLVANGKAVYVPVIELELELDLGTVAGVLEQVGDDKIKAQAALAAEQGKGDAARSTLISKLEAIIAD